MSRVSSFFIVVYKLKVKKNKIDNRFSTSHLRRTHWNHSPSTKVMKNFQLSITSIQFFKKKFVTIARQV